MATLRAPVYSTDSDDDIVSFTPSPARAAATTTTATATGCGHSNKCGCYAALVEEKSQLELKLRKMMSKQQNFLVQLRNTIVETTILSNADDMIRELTNLDSTIEKYMLSMENETNSTPRSKPTPATVTTTPPQGPKRNEFTSNGKHTSSSSTSTTTTATTTTTTATTTTEPTTPISSIDKPNGHLTPEEVADILHEEDEQTRKEKEKRTMDDFKIALSFQPRQCPMCLDDVEVDFISVLSYCNHEYCRDCLIHYVTDKITSKSFPINCPLPECKKEISVYDFEILLDAKMMEKYNEFIFSNTIETNPETYSCCPTADCGYVFLYEKGDSSDFNCEKCKKRYCLTCRADYHQGSTCEQYQKWLKENGQADQLFEQFAQGMKLKKCPKCYRWTEKISGCNHMSCKCGQQFCYHCGNSYPCNCGQNPHVHAMGRYLLFSCFLIPLTLYTLNARNLNPVANDHGVLFANPPPNPFAFFNVPTIPINNPAPNPFNNPNPNPFTNPNPNPFNLNPFTNPTPTLNPFNINTNNNNLNPNNPNNFNPNNHSGRLPKRRRKHHDD